MELIKLFGDEKVQKPSIDFSLRQGYIDDGEETTCRWCIQYLEEGDNYWSDRDTGSCYCSRSCATEHIESED